MCLTRSSLAVLICIHVLLRDTEGTVDLMMQMKSSQVEKGCQRDQDCAHFARHDLISSARCVQEECECSNADKTVLCFPYERALHNEVGGKCPCEIDNTECSPLVNTCECKPNFQPSEDNRHCDPILSRLGSICDVDENCHRAEVFSTCSSANATKEKVCQCATGFVRHNDTCFSQLDPRDGGASSEITCNDTEACRNVSSNSECVSGKCVCLAGFVTSLGNSSACLPEVGWSVGCSETRQCVRKMGLGAVCSDFCGCKDGFDVHTINSFPENASICVRKIEFQSNCTNDIHCAAENEDPRSSLMKCWKGRCRCKEGYVYERTGCVRAPPSDVSGTPSWHVSPLLVFVLAPFLGNIL